MKSFVVFALTVLVSATVWSAQNKCVQFKPNFLQSKNIRTFIIATPVKTSSKKSALVRLIVQDSGVLDNDGYVNCEHVKTKWHCSIDDDGGNFEYNSATLELTTSYFDVGNIESDADGSIEIPTHQPFVLQGKRIRCPKADF
jgi:hypothetical protein